MSEEQLKAFIAKVQADPSLQEQLKAEGADVVAIAKAAGFSITTEDLNSHRQKLTDYELEGAAGGKYRVSAEIDPSDPCFYRDKGILNPLCRLNSLVGLPPWA